MPVVVPTVAPAASPVRRWSQSPAPGRSFGSMRVGASLWEASASGNRMRAPPLGLDSGAAPVPRRPVDLPRLCAQRTWAKPNRQCQGHRPLIAPRAGSGQCQGICPLPRARARPPPAVRSRHPRRNLVSAASHPETPPGAPREQQSGPDATHPSLILTGNSGQAGLARTITARDDATARRANANDGSWYLAVARATAKYHDPRSKAPGPSNRKIDPTREPVHHRSSRPTPPVDQPRVSGIGSGPQRASW
jgi:hypothetical protein